jgi:hypothetical protein
MRMKFVETNRVVAGSSCCRLDIDMKMFIRYSFLQSIVME